MAIKAVQIFLKHTEEFSDETKALIDEIRLAAGLAQFLLRPHPGRLQEDQRVEVSVHHRLFQRHGRPAAASCITWCSACPTRATLVLFIGFQAPGTRGYEHQEWRAAR